ncbi:uncharacterized protein LOC103704730 [Phoenix dactylifera]|uniref:Uncharacterized protein LOC103704730 n=1 Tax=Phoenix dactylifera TaxID=42345 RepID=A0A8B7BVM7_PHODC|nr:uncharacterized protein LOC103704730 [Phoenix dactylifera]
MDVLEDSWVTEQPINQLPTMVDSTRIAGYRVCDLMDPDGGRWREELIQEVFREQLAVMIMGLPVPIREVPDRNAGLFEGRRWSSRMVVDRAVLHAGEVTGATALFSSGMARDIWDTLSAVTAPKFALVSWVPPPHGHLKVNFNDSRSMDGGSKGVDFVIRDSLGRLIAAEGRRMPGLTVIGAELRAAWEGLSYVMRVLGAVRVHLEEDSSAMIDWIQDADRYGDGHPLILEIRRFVQEMGDFQVAHMYRKANRAVDWVVSYVARHSEEFL